MATEQEIYRTLNHVMKLAGKMETVIDDMWAIAENPYMTNEAKIEALKIQLDKLKGKPK